MDDDRFSSDAGDGSRLPAPPPAVPAGGTWSVDTPSDETPTPAAPRRRAPAALVVGIVIALLLVGGATAAFLAMRGADEELLGMMPADAQVVVVAYLDPAASQKANLVRMASRFPELGTPQEALDKVRTFLDEGLRPIGLDGSAIDWLGVEAGVTVRVTSMEADPDAAILIDTDDEDAAAADLADGRTATGDRGWASSDYGGIEIWSSTDGSDYTATAMLNGVVVVASSESAMHGVIDAAGGQTDSVAGSSAFTEATAALPEGKLGLLYVDVAGLAQSLRSELETSGASLTGLGDLDAVRGVAGSLSAEPDGLAFDISASYDPSKLSEEMRAQLSAPDEPNELAGLIPADALVVYGAQHVDLAANSFVSQLEETEPEAVRSFTEAGIAGDDGLLAHLTGELAIEAAPEAGGIGVGGALLVGVDDPVVAKQAIESLTSLAYGTMFQATQEFSSSSGELHFEGAGTPTARPAWRSEDYRGVEIRTLILPYGGPSVAYAIVEGAAVVATSDRQLRVVIDTMKDGASFDIGETFGSVPTSDGFLYVDPAGIASAIRASLPPDQQQRFDEEVTAYVKPIRAVLVGTEGDESHQRARFFASIP